MSPKILSNVPVDPSVNPGDPAVTPGADGITPLANPPSTDTGTLTACDPSSAAVVVMLPAPTAAISTVSWEGPVSSTRISPTNIPSVASPAAVELRLSVVVPTPAAALSLTVPGSAMRPA